MSDLDVGKRAVRTTAQGDEAVCDVLAYDSGRDQGDHYVFGGSTPAEKAAGGGDAFSGWLVVGTGPGTIRIK